jgi:alkylhydroperoxidase family enzyme
VCSSARSAAAPVAEEDVRACARPDFDHPDPPTRAALRFARTLVLDDGEDAARYAELQEHFSWAQIIELVSFFCLVLGDVRMVKSFGLESLLAV